MDDTFSIGPIFQINKEAGIVERFKWLHQSFSNESNYRNLNGYIVRYRTFLQALEELNEGEHVTIWHTDSAHEYVGLVYVIYLLKDKNVSIMLLNMSEVYQELFYQKDVTYTIRSTGDFTPEQFYTMQQNVSGNLLSAADRSTYEKKWLTLSDTRETLRIWENGNISPVREDYFDELLMKIIKRCTPLYQKDYVMAVRIIGEMIGQVDQYIGDSFFEYRLRALIHKGLVSYEGDLNEMRYYRVRIN